MMGRRKNKQRRNISAIKADSGKIKYEEGHSEESDILYNKEKHELGVENPSTIENDQIKNGCAKVEETDVTFETLRPNTDRVMGREYFIHSLCQICKEELNNRILCPKCRLISYCCQSHRRQHWPIHADLCQAITEVCADRQVDHIMEGSINCSADEFRILRFQNMVQCEGKVNRQLDKWEREMFIFPNICGTCYEYDPQRLVVCGCCRHSGFCKDHWTKKHDEWCEVLLRYKNIIKNHSKFGIICPSIPKSKLSLVLPKLRDMKQFFKGVIDYIDFFEYVELTEITTYPLTALNALLFINKNKQQPKNTTIHVIGAEADFEIHKPEKWEYYILHLVPELKNLEIEFIGPELKPTAEQKAVTVCSKCKAAEKSMTLRFHRDLYHIFSKKPKFSRPQLICVFNPGLYRTTGFNKEDTWSPTIVSMFAQKCPVLSTAYTHKEMFLDVQRVKQTQVIALFIEPTLNAFSSMKPNLNFVSEEDSPVVFKNQFYCLMSSA